MSWLSACGRWSEVVRAPPPCPCACQQQLCLSWARLRELLSRIVLLNRQRVDANRHPYEWKVYCASRIGRPCSHSEPLSLLLQIAFELALCGDAARHQEKTHLVVCQNDTLRTGDWPLPVGCMSHGQSECEHVGRRAQRQRRGVTLKKGASYGWSIGSSATSATRFPQRIVSHTRKEKRKMFIGQHCVVR